MEQAFIKIATFNYSSEAEIIKARLLSEGIDAFLKDNNHIDADPLISVAIGGVKLMVPSHQLEKSKEILDAIHEFSVTDAGDLMTCPKCEATTIVHATTVTDVKSLFFFVFGFIFSGLPFYAKHTYRCESCEHKFNINE